jgi:outer membrane protein assembly factor BamE (lipoprotein component of BamABCDE complex)
MPFIILRRLPAGPCAALALLAALSACSSTKSSDSVLGLVTPYRIEVVQGNVVTREMAAAVKPGMSRTQVRDILGSPLLTDVFHANRWDYIFTIRRQGAEPQLRRVTAYFDGEKLQRLESWSPSRNCPARPPSSPPSTPSRKAARRRRRLSSMRPSCKPCRHPRPRRASSPKLRRRHAATRRSNLDGAAPLCADAAFHPVAVH